MHIQSVTIQNFRCFGPEPVTVTLDSEVTALIGSNGAGKSAFLEALKRLFGATREERTLSRADVHFGVHETPDTVDERQVVIDVVFAFPELDAADPGHAVPHVFHVMTAAKPGEPLKARMRLEALWKRGESFIDEIESAVYWVTRLGEIEFGEDEAAGLDKQRVHLGDRGKVQLVYIPATRDGSAVTRQALRQVLRRLERSGDFTDADKASIQEVGASMQEKIDGLPSVKWLTKELTECWSSLHVGSHLQTPKLTVITQEFVQVLRSLTAKLLPGPDGRERSIEELSEGQSSLFFLALSATLARLEAALASSNPPDGFSDADIVAPAMTIYAIEEPETHLAPFFLARLMRLLGDLSSGYQAMGLVTSHSPSVVRRVRPEAIRHFRLDQKLLTTMANQIVLPDADDEAAKFVREAVLAAPEIYFADLVILGEGDSEEVVIPKIAKACGVELDPSFVAFAPLGGRHVNHFWRLLTGLGIPMLTLLDFDMGRNKAGPLRLKYAHDQLRKIGVNEKPVWVKGDPKKASYWKGLKKGGVQQWRTWMEAHGVFFSYPLDLDMLMLRSYPDGYEVSDFEVPEDLSNVSKSVFGDHGAGLVAYEDTVFASFHPSSQELVAYDALFKKRGKPGSHLAAFAELSAQELKDKCPAQMRRLIQAAFDGVAKGREGSEA